MSEGSRSYVRRRKQWRVSWARAWMSLCWRIWLSLKKIRLPSRNGRKKGRRHWIDNYGVFKRPLVISQGKKEMVAGAAHHPRRIDRGTGRIGGDVRAGAFY